MEKFPKGNKSSAKTNAVPKRPDAFSDKANGSMDYMNKQDSMASQDSSKLKKGGYKNGRYDG